MTLSKAENNITTAGVTTLLKTGLAGALAAEAWYLGQIISTRLCIAITTHLNCFFKNTFWQLSDDQITIGMVFFTIVISIIAVLMTITVSCRLIFSSSIPLVLKSKRIDLLIALIISFSMILFFGGIGNKYYQKIPNQFFLALVITPFLMWFLLKLRAKILGSISSNETIKSYFINDVEKNSKEEDLLGISDNAERFAEWVYNNGSSDSVVFGIDAPWGIGKSSFINICQEYWKDEHSDHVIVYKFNPLRFEGRSNILENFIDGLVRAIQKKVFLPEIRPLISRYSQFIKGKGTIKVPLIDYEIISGTYSIDDAFNDIEFALRSLDKKILVIVDDLDRLSYSAIKEVLFVIKKSFTLPNISYVLCYDTDNIAALEKNNSSPDQVAEFLEKFVNVKTSLFLDSEKLINFVTKNLEKVLSDTVQANPFLVSQAMGGLIEIYKGPDYHKYLPFLGDVRKLKRLLNIFMFLELEQTDFKDSDINKKDLINLLLIFINYPNIFRKIYNAETNGKRGFFSVNELGDENYPLKEGENIAETEEPKIRNSKLYSDYTERLGENAKFLLNQIFDSSIHLKNLKVYGKISEENKQTLACFNGGVGGKNLVIYLNLIVNITKPLKRDQHTFYVNAKNNIANGTPLNDIFSKPEFSADNNEDSHEKLWRVIVNSLTDFNGTIGTAIITYMLNNISRYSLVKNKTIGIGFRHNLAYFLLTMLNRIGWSDNSGSRHNNTPENISEIAEWVFGEGRHNDIGVLNMLSQPDRGIMGLNDLMLFRLYCSADRGGDLFNIRNAISLHANTDAPTSGGTSEIAKEGMREISQKVFNIFKTQYIDKKINIFKQGDELTLEQMTGDWANYVKSQIEQNRISDEEINIDMAKAKSQMIAFITYQLGNNFISSGVGCGYYDVAGNADKHGIATEMNNYLFNHCFNSSVSPSNYLYFLDYLLINLSSDFGSDNDTYTPNIDQFTKVLDKKLLTNYWKENSDPHISPGFGVILNFFL